jgi:hypothetical protein
MQNGDQLNSYLKLEYVLSYIQLFLAVYLTALSSLNRRLTILVYTIGCVSGAPLDRAGPTITESQVGEVNVVSFCGQQVHVDRVVDWNHEGNVSLVGC